MPLRARKNFSPSSLAPPGTIINHVNPISIGQKIVISNPLLATLAFIFVCLRLFVRWRVVKVLGWEDGETSKSPAQNLWLIINMQVLL